ncbi:MAG: serine/threonine protein kinase [Polyangiaceae bacterium]|nr:serine/threonine protein kinase [Polyangiaceae bacterium]
MAGAPASEGTLAEGTKVGDYVVEAAIAEGGFGAVYRVVHPVIGKSAAIKVLKRELSANPEVVSRFITEARAVNQIRHKNIVDIFAFGTLPDGRHYCVMELLGGPTLDQVIKSRGPLPVAEILPIVRQLARALEAAHAVGITHRDLKPENVIVTYDEDGAATPKLLDFGIAKLRDRPDSIHKTRSGIPMGTPLYMSPEQVQGEPADPRSDIYSLGVLVHEAIVGTPPFDGRSVMEVLAAHMTRQPPRMSSLRSDLPPALDEPVLHMLEKDPARRPQSVMDAVSELYAAAERSGVRVTMTAQERVVAASSSQRNDSGDRGYVTNGDGVRRETLAAATTVAVGTPTYSEGRRARTAYVVLGCMAILGIGAGLVAMVHGPSRAKPSSAATVSDAPPASAAPTEVTSDLPSSRAPVVVVDSASASPHASVKITFEHAPPETEVFLGGKKLGTTDAPIELEKGSGALQITLQKKGFASREVAFVPDADRAIDAKLTRASGPRPRTPNGDLEF